VKGNANVADLTAIIGATGSGKTILTKRLLREAGGAPALIWSPKEHQDKYAPEFGRRIEASAARLQRLVADGESVVYVPRRDRAELLELQFSFFCGLAFAAGNRRVLVEEMALVATSRTAPPRWTLLVTEGRGRGLALMATTQRPQLCDASLLDAATVIFCGRLNRGSSKKIMADAMDAPLDRLRGLQPLQFLHWRAGEDQLAELTVQVPRARRLA
jgi:DNA helicase HerA-like ATPase